MYGSIIGVSALPFMNSIGIFFKFVETSQELILILYLNTDLPLNLQNMLSFLKYYQLSLILPPFWLPVIQQTQFDKKSISDIYEIPYPKTKFLYNNISSSFLVNALSLIFVSTIIPWFFILIMKLLRKFRFYEKIKNKKIKKTFIYLENLFCYNLLFTLFLASILENSLYIALEWKNVSFNNAFNIFSFIFSIIYFIYILFMLLWLIKISDNIILEGNKNPLSEKSPIPISFQSIFNQIKCKKRSTIFYVIMRIFKKMFLSFIIVFFYFDLMLQISSVIIITIMTFLYFGVLSTLENKFRNLITELIEMLVEVYIVLYFYNLNMNYKIRIHWLCYLEKFL